MKLGNTTFSPLLKVNDISNNPSKQRQGVLNLNANIEHSALGHFTDSVHEKEVMIRSRLIELMETIQAQLSEHSTTPHQIKNYLSPTDEVDPRELLSLEKDIIYFSNTPFEHDESSTGQNDLAREFANYAEAYKEVEAPPSKGILIVSDNGSLDDEKVAFWVHPRFDDLPPALNIHTDIVDEDNNPNLEIEKKVIAQIMQHFHDQELINKTDITSMFIYETEEDRLAGNGFRPVFKEDKVSLEPHRLNVLT
jgi:hypothetical protein